MRTISMNWDVTRQDGGEIVDGRIACLVALSSVSWIFAKWVNLQWGTKEDDVLKQSQAFFSIRWLSTSSCSDSESLTMETAIFVKSHLKKWLLSPWLPRGANKRLDLSKSSNTGVYWVGGPARSARHSWAHFAMGLGSFENGTNGKWPPREF